MTALGPNADLIGLPGSRHLLSTPALVLDLDLLERNIATMARLIAAAGLTLRPHAKTHKCSAIARRQIAAGAVGVSCASIREAEAMVAAGVAGVHLTSPVVGPRKIARLAVLARQAERLSVVTDHPDNAGALSAALREVGARLDVVVDFDIGLGRTGAATIEDAVALARQVAVDTQFRFAGVQAYSGGVQHIEAYRERERVYGAQLGRLSALVTALRDSGLPPEVVTGGGTGTFAIDCARRVMTEHQAGSYIVMDVEYEAVQLQPDEMSPFATALTVLCSVVSANARGYVTIDGGFKTFATDGPAPGVGAGAPPGTRYERFGDEHGKLVFAEPNDTLRPGAKVALVTPHCDPTINLHDFFHCVRGDTLAEIWPIDARGVL